MVISARNLWSSSWWASSRIGMISPCLRRAAKPRRSSLQQGSSVAKTTTGRTSELCFFNGQLRSFDGQGAPFRGRNRHSLSKRQEEQQRRNSSSSSFSTQTVLTSQDIEDGASVTQCSEDGYRDADVCVPDGIQVRNHEDLTPHIHPDTDGIRIGATTAAAAVLGVSNEAVGSHQLVWKASPMAEKKDPNAVPWTNETWNHAIDEGDANALRDALESIGQQERQGGRMSQSQLGVLRQDPSEDMRLLIENYTVPALASALRDREELLQLCASLLSEGRIKDLREILMPFERRFVQSRRRQENKLDLTTRGGFDTASLEQLRRGLMRMPRRVSQAHQKRAGVVLPLCNVHGVPSVLFEKRAASLRAHPDEVCLPGGMVSEASDKSIVLTCLREMSEEIEGMDADRVTVLGVLRCNWGEVYRLTGVAVTPVVCFVGEIGELDLRPNPDEVAECFTVPLSSLVDRQRWVHRQDYAPVFTGGPHIIWGLTGYIVNRFVKDVLARYTVNLPDISEDGV